MKENKYRAWYKGDIERGEPLLFEQTTIDDELFFICSSDPEIKYPFYIPFIDDDWIVEQGTGLYDKDGVEIYEGDIVIYDFARYTTKEEPIAGIVKYKTECASYGIVPLAYMDSIVLVGDLDLNAPLEVIGNIHDKESK